MDLNKTYQGNIKNFKKIETVFIVLQLMILGYEYIKPLVITKI
jgi:hypothetical protein